MTQMADEAPGGTAEHRDNATGETPSRSPGDLRSTMALKVRGFHVDVFGHVNHARYLEFLEEARWTFLEGWPALTAALHARGIVHAVVNINIDYKSQATVGHLLRIEIVPISVGRSSLVIEQTIKQADTGKVVVEARITNVFFDSANGKVTSVRDDLVAHWPVLGNAQPGAPEA